MTQQKAGFQECILPGDLISTQMGREGMELVMLNLKEFHNLL